jgi:carbon monoxide dehydrogenase subunit G
MTRMSDSIEVDATPETVWRVVADPHNLTLWDRHIADVSGLPDGGLREGTRYTTEVRFMGARAHTISEVEELRAPAYARVRLEGVIDGTVESFLEPLDGGRRTRLTHTVEYRFRGGPIGALGARAVRMVGGPLVLRRGMLAQKRQAEVDAQRAR